MSEKTNKLQKAQLHVTGMTCASCVATVEKTLKKTKGITQARVNLASEKASLEYDPKKVDFNIIETLSARQGTAWRHKNRFSRCRA